MKSRPLIYSHKICLLLNESFQGSLGDAGDLKMCKVGWPLS